MSDATETPELRFFQTRPANLLACPPLASSLQSFESCLYFIGLARYPHALTACTLAIEGGIKASFNLPSEGGGDNFKELLARVRQEKPSLRVFPQDNIDNLRKTRNRIVHYGFSPKDDKMTAGLLLESAIPFLRAVYEAYFQFDLCDALDAEFSAQLRHALKAFDATVRPGVDSDPTRCFLALGHLVCCSLKASLMSRWEVEATDDADTHGLKSEIVEKQRHKMERLFEPSWAFDCPICGGFETLICQMIDGELDECRVSLSQALCLECGLTVPKDTSYLLDAICREQVEKKRETILRELGIT